VQQLAHGADEPLVHGRGGTGGGGRARTLLDLQLRAYDLVRVRRDRREHLGEARAHEDAAAAERAVVAFRPSACVH
jgi:hypothetical protein